MPADREAFLISSAITTFMREYGIEAKFALRTLDGFEGSVKLTFHGSFAFPWTGICRNEEP